MRNINLNDLRAKVATVWDTLGDAEVAAENKRKSKTALEALGITNEDIDHAFNRGEQHTASLLNYVNDITKNNR